MSKYTINHACGHETTQQMYGKISERDRKAEWWATVDCPACYGHAQAEIRNNQRNLANDKINTWARAGIGVGVRLYNPQQQRTIEIIELDAMHEDIAVIREVTTDTANGIVTRVKVENIIKAIADGKATLMAKEAV